MMSVSPYYSKLRPEILALIPSHTAKLLDVGCGAGVMLAEAKRSGVRQVYGIEVEGSVAREAEPLLDGLLVDDIEQAAIPWKDFDCITCADVLEHLKDPWLVLRKLRSLLSENGVIVASIPNIAHFSVLVKILRDRFVYENQGILDRTHLRFFTRRTIADLFGSTGYEIIHLGATYDNWNATRLFRWMTLRLLDHCAVFQYLVVARAKKAASSI
jgi:2-polyprenyl-3-methyl-5-hydroxy-6-metoxy-1,4-benzoquinol methylase